MKVKTESLLSDVAYSLYNKHASLFVGAGFSRNAENDSNVGIIPLWSDLGDMFYRELTGKKPRPADKSYVNVMKLADDVKNYRGKGKLEDILTQSICDSRRHPSELHRKLLSLPWLNVYTTNYDTLLERTVKQGLTGKYTYDIVDKESDLPLTTSSSIIKLHGSIEDPGSMIITEEDYRKYPKDHEVFVNCVRNSFVKSCMIMVGFSGEDPNFNSWLGWVNDQLEDNAPTVYLISTDKISDARIASLNKKNIKVIFLSDVAEKSASIQEKWNIVFDYLDNKSAEFLYDDERLSKDTISWGQDESGKLWTPDTDYMDLYRFYKSNREKYPGWLVLPRDKRERFNNNNYLSLSKGKLDKLKRPYDLLFLDEFNWLIEKCLFPMENQWEPIYLSIINKYKPTRLNSDKKKQEAWLNLKIALLRLYRQENWEEKWVTLKDEIQIYHKFLNEEQKAKFQYEKCLESIYECDFANLTSLLEEWNIPLNSYWSIIKASLLAEYINLEEGKKLATKSFEKIAKSFETCKGEEKIYWASRKNAAHTILNVINSANFSYDKNDDTVRETWQTLKKYEDIWYEREFFDSKLRYFDDVRRVSKKIPKFELGYSSVTTSMSGNSDDYRVAYAFFNYYEDLGYPIHLPFLTTINKTTLEKALSIMSFCSPIIAENWMQRFGDEGMVSYVFSRRRLNISHAEEVTSVFDKYLSLFESLSISSSPQCWVQPMCTIIPEALSRLCTKASFQSRKKTLEIIGSIYDSGRANEFKNIEILVSRLMETFTITEKQRLMPFLITIPIRKDKSSFASKSDPLRYVSDIENIPHKLNLSKIWKAIVLGIDSTDSIREAYVFRAFVLYNFHQLSHQQEEELSEILWKHTNKDGFPDNTFLYEFAFLNYPHPNNINPANLLHTYFSTHTIPYNKDPKSVAMQVNIPIIGNLEGTCNKDIDFQWSTDELTKIIHDVNTAWSFDKKLLECNEKSFGLSISAEYKSKYVRIVRALSKVIETNKELVSEESLTSLKSFIDEIKNSGVPAFSLTSLFPEWYDSQIQNKEFHQSLSSNNVDYIVDCLNYVIREINNGHDVNDKLVVVSENFRCNTEPARISIIRTISHYIDCRRNNIPANIQQNIELGLNNLFTYSTIEDTDSELIVNEKLDIRKEVAPIIGTLRNTMTNNDIVNQWVSYYEDNSTFLEIKKAFYDSVN